MYSVAIRNKDTTGEVRTKLAWLLSLLLQLGCHPLPLVCVVKGQGFCCADKCERAGAFCSTARDKFSCRCPNNMLRSRLCSLSKCFDRSDSVKGLEHSFCSFCRQTFAVLVRVQQFSLNMVAEKASASCQRPETSTHKAQHHITRKLLLRPAIAAQVVITEKHKKPRT
jgi:hypothetical protein